jgi:hypothetical protein
MRVAPFFLLSAGVISQVAGELPSSPALTNEIITVRDEPDILEAAAIKAMLERRDLAGDLWAELKSATTCGACQVDDCERPSRMMEG